MHMSHRYVNLDEVVLRICRRALLSASLSPVATMHALSRVYRRSRRRAGLALASLSSLAESGVGLPPACSSMQCAARVCVCVCGFESISYPLMRMR